MEDQKTTESPVRPSIESLAKAYIKVRDARDEAKAKAEEEDRKLKEQLDLLAAEMDAICKEQNATSIRTESGTVIRKITTRYWSTDWDSMRSFIKEHDALMLMEQRLHQTNMKAFLEENPDLMPPGLQVDRAYTIVVNRSKK